MQDEELMRLAIAEAAKAAAEGEIPVGAVVVRRGEVVAAAHNRRETGKNALLISALALFEFHFSSKLYLTISRFID